MPRPSDSAMGEANRERRQQTVPLLLAAGFPTIVGFKIVLLLLVGNARELILADVPLTMIATAGLVLWSGLFAALQWGGRTGKCLWAIFCAYAAFWLLRDTLFPLPLNEFDGTTPLDDPTIGYVTAEIATFLVALGALLAVERRKTATVLSMFVLVFGVSDAAVSNLKCNRGSPTGPRKLG